MTLSVLPVKLNNITKLVNQLLKLRDSYLSVANLNLNKLVATIEIYCESRKT